MGFKVNEKGVFVTSAGVAMRDKDLPTLRWGDGFSISIVLPAGSVAAEDRFCLAVDVDRFLGNGLCALSETATIDVANNTVSFDGIATNTQKFLNAVNGKAGCIEGQMQLVRYVGGDLSERQTLLDDRCMLKGLVYVNGATVYILDPNAAYTKEQVDAIFATAVVFQFSADGENWHDEQVDADVFLRFKNPAVETAAWSDAIRFQRSDIVPLIERAETAATAAETAKGKAETAKGKAEAARDEAVNAKTAAVDAKATAIQKASETADNAALAVSAKNAAANSAATANQKATIATNAANAAAGHAVEANAAKTAAQNSANAAAGAVATVNTAKTAVANDKTAVADMKGEVQTMKQAVVEASESAANSKTAAVDAKTLAVGASETAVTAKNAAETARTGAENALTEFESRLSSSYVYGIDWKDADLTQGNAGKSVVLNNIYDNVQYDATLRYMEVESHGVLPAHNWKRCTMATARTVNYYLGQSDSRKKADGTAAILTGADGDVMSEIEIVYFRIDQYVDANSIQHIVWLCSDKHFNGSKPYPFFYVSPDGRTLRKQYVAAFRTSICDADGNSLNNNFTATSDTTYAADKTYYTRSVNVFTPMAAGTDYTVGGDITQGSTVDTKIYVKTVVSSPTGYSAGRKGRSIAGALPAGNITRANFRLMHGNNGFDSINFLFGSFLGMMMAIEYGTLSAQAKFSVGYSNLQSWDYRSMRLTGRTAIFGNNSGEIIADDADSDGVDYDILSMKSGGTSLWNATAQGNHAQRVVQCSYRGIEDPFGSLFTLDDGIQKNQDAYDVSITYDGNVYLRDDHDDPVSINLYCWKNGSNVKFYTTSAEPAVGANLYKQVAMSEVQGTVASVAEDFSTITVGTAEYTRSAADDTDGHSYAWKYNESVIYSHVINPHTDANTRQVYSDAQLTVLLGNVSAVADDYSESGYWFTQSTAKYSYLDTNRGRLKGSEYVFPETGYTGEETVWVHHEWPKDSIYPCYFDRVTFLPLYRAGNWGATNKGLCDYLYNNASTSARVVARLGHAASGASGGPFFVTVIYGLASAIAAFGSRLAA